MNEAKIVYLDIECSPSLGYVWGKYQQDVVEFKEEWQILSYAYKFEGGKVEVKALPDYECYEEEGLYDGELIRDLWQVLDDADIVIGHNIDRFDIRKANTRFLYHGLPMPSPFKTVDTLKLARKHFMFNSNKLGDLAQYLRVGEKLDTGGFQLWLDCIAGVPDAWGLMKQYNVRDVEITEKVYKELRTFSQAHPNQNVFNGTSYSCPTCGSHDVQKRGYNVTRTGKYQRYQCQDCTAWSTGEKIKSDKIVLR